MRYVDQACAWMILLAGVAHILITELAHIPGAVLDPGVMWIFLAMLNLLRIRNGYRVQGLKTCCIGANVATLIIEIVRWKMFGLRGGVLAIVVFCETIFSIRQKQ